MLIYIDKSRFWDKLKQRGGLFCRTQVSPRAAGIHQELGEGRAERQGAVLTEDGDSRLAWELLQVSLSSLVLQGFLILRESRSHYCSTEIPMKVFFVIKKKKKAGCSSARL